MKKFLSLVLSVMMIISSFSCITFAENEIKITLNGTALTMDQPPIIVEGRTLVPLRAIFEALGATVTWDDATKCATGVLDSKTVSLVINNTQAKVNGTDVTLDVPAQIVNSRTLVPVRFISESLGCKVDWDDATKTVIIESEIGLKPYKEWTFDNITSFENNVDYILGGAYPVGNVSISDKYDANGSGKALLMENRENQVYRLKLKNVFTKEDLGKTFTIEAKILAPDDDGTVVVAAFSDTKTQYATTPKKEQRANVKKNEWQFITFTYTHEEEIVTQLGFGQPNSAKAIKTLVVDDVKIYEGTKEEKEEKPVELPKEHKLLEPGVKLVSDGHRPVPTNFKTGKGYEDIIYYEKEIRDNEAIYNSLPKGSIVIDDSILSKYYVSETNSEFGTIEVVDVEGMPFKKALRATCTKLPPNNPYQFQAQFGNFLEGKAEEGDILLLKFYMRTIYSEKDESGNGQIMPIIELKVAPNTKKIAAEVVNGSEWKAFYFPFVYDGEFTRGTLRFGYALQQVEVGGYEIFNFKDTVKIEDLPNNDALPMMHQRDAAWRREAWDRIEKIRKSDIKVIVKDALGNVIPNAEVKVNMYETEFEWGTAIGSGVLTKADYQKTLSENFNTVVCENDNKWNYYIKDPNAAKNQFEVCKLLGIKNFRGHTLMWDKASVNNGINSAFPDYLPDYFDKYDEMQKIINDHIVETMKEFEGTVGDWDVLNEAQRKDMRIIPKYGVKMIKEWYDTARNSGVDSELYYNDYKTQDEMVNFVKWLIDGGVDFDGVGLQSHHDQSGSNIETTMKWWQKIADMGKRLKITEYDFATDNEELQASYTRDFMIAAYSIEAFDGFVMWGHCGGGEKKARVLYDGNFKPRLTLEVWQDLIYNKWWTNEEGTTNNNGEYTTRGFHGDYDITASANGKTKTVNAKCSKDGDNTVVITLD
ncbi:MAG: hypothetical protein E7391_08940 [Ruminococcaceae bacterium]|nr:hypothetical protein [Oscillospiraceae bacterium]